MFCEDKDISSTLNPNNIVFLYCLFNMFSVVMHRTAFFPLFRKRMENPIKVRFSFLICASFLEIMPLFFLCLVEHWKGS